jgi:dienelactone hydrolase
VTIPNGEGPFPVVILVHGSGAHDRDETIASNKPFKDLAWGLGSKGIAVFRYVKRNKEHQAALIASKEPFTVYKETVEDALEAVKLMRKTPKIDPTRVFILGHSLGGMMIPRIGKGDKAIVGFISMAGSLRPLEEITLDQVHYLRSIKKNPTKAELQVFDSLEKGVKQVRALKEGDSGFILGAPAPYWIDFKSYDWTGAAKELEMPLMILQGKRDYQITLEKDFALWKTTLAGKPGVTFKSYPKLNHLFMEGSGEGLSRPDDYAVPGHIAPYVIEDIAGFVKAAH